MVQPNHENRDCREAIVLAIYLAKQWQQSFFVHYVDWSGQYTLESRAKFSKHRQLGFVVSPTGEVSPQQGFPSYAELFGGEDVVVQFRFRGRNDEWDTLKNETFRMHEKQRAKSRAVELNARANGMEYRTWPE
jgi:hypothetical protein